MTELQMVRFAFIGLSAIAALVCFFIFLLQEAKQPGQKMLRWGIMSVIFFQSLYYWSLTDQRVNLQDEIKKIAISGGAETLSAPDGN